MRERELVRTAVGLVTLAAVLALGAGAAVAASKPTKPAKPAKLAKHAKPPKPAKPAAPRTWPQNICGQLVPLVRSVSGAQVQANLQKQGGATVLDCRYTAGGIDGAFLLESKQVPKTWLTQTLAQFTAAAPKQTCGDLATPSAVPLKLVGLGDEAFSLDSCPGDTFTNKAMGQTDVYAIKGTTGWWIATQTPFATTTVAKLTALLKKLIATYP